MARMIKLLNLILLTSLLVGQSSQAEIVNTWYVSDSSGSPVVALNQQGNVKWRKHYKPYGEAIDPPVTSNHIGYTGHVHDNSTGLTYMGARYYDPLVGRFMGMDPAGVDANDPRTFNRYAYANNSPYMYVDPDGNNPVGIFLRVAGFYIAQKVFRDPKTAKKIGDIAKEHLKPKTIVSPSPKQVPKSTGKTAKEGIYEFTDTAGEKYCGQSCNIPNRLKQHQKTGKLDANQSVQTTEVLGGKTAREIAEHKRIQEITGGVPARFSDKVSNKVDPIGPNRSHLLD